MNNTFPVCKNCVYSEIPSAEEPCADCQIHFAKDRSKPHFKSRSKPTHADSFRAMTDEELAQFFRDCVACDDCPVGDSKCKRAFALCKNTALAWLKSPEEVDT